MKTPTEPPTPTIHSDIRASRRTSHIKWLQKLDIRALCLVVSDITALAIAWKFAQFLNQFYSPLPGSLVWWTWLGLPSVFWLFVGCILSTFAHCRLYSYLTAAKDYARAVQLISHVYLASLVVSYFYDPHLDLPRSLFFSSWLTSIIAVVTARLLTHLLLHQFESHRKPTTVFLIAPASRLQLLSQAVEDQPYYRVVGAAIASTAHSAATFHAITKHQPKEVLAEDIPSAELASTLFWRLRSVGIDRKSVV